MSAQDLCDNEHHFGGTTVVLAGDFRQVLPVIPGGRRPDVSACIVKRLKRLWMTVSSPNSACMSSTYTYQVVTMHLKENLRVRYAPDTDAEEQKEFEAFLLSVGEGTVSS